VARGVKDIELMILATSWTIRRRQVSRPAVKPADRAVFASAASYLPRSAKPLLLVTLRTEEWTVMSKPLSRTASAEEKRRQSPSSAQIAAEVSGPLPY
jgi:hypothetical protein